MHPTQAAPARAISTLWISIMLAASVASTLLFACAMPFEAIAAFAALHFPRRDGVLLTVSCWLANQASGFGLLGYPVDGPTIVWGGGIALAALASLIAAGWAAGRFRRGAGVARAALALACAYLALKAVLLCFALALGGVETTLSPYYNAVQIVRDVAFMAGFAALYAGLRRIGLPALRGAVRAA